MRDSLHMEIPVNHLQGRLRYLKAKGLSAEKSRRGFTQMCLALRPSLGSQICQSYGLCLFQGYTTTHVDEKSRKVQQVQTSTCTSVIFAIGNKTFFFPQPQTRSFWANVKCTYVLVKYSMAKPWWFIPKCNHSSWMPSLSHFNFLLGNNTSKRS